MTKYRIISLCLFSILFGIGLGFVANDLAIAKGIDPELEPYYTEVLVFIKNKCTEKQYNNTELFNVKFGELKDKDIGMCLRGLVAYKIIIDPRYWNRCDTNTRFQLVAHEMMHCLLHIEHSIDRNDFMFPTLKYMSKLEVIDQLNSYLDYKCKRRIK